MTKNDLQVPSNTISCETVFPQQDIDLMLHKIETHIYLYIYFSSLSAQNSFIWYFVIKTLTMKLKRVQLTSWSITSLLCILRIYLLVIFIYRTICADLNCLHTHWQIQRMWKILKITLFSSMNIFHKYMIVMLTALNCYLVKNLVKYTSNHFQTC